MGTDCPNTFLNLNVDLSANFDICKKYEKECDKTKEPKVYFNN